jgi:hypothetical protein
MRPPGRCNDPKPIFCLESLTTTDVFDVQVAIEVVLVILMMFIQDSSSTCKITTHSRYRKHKHRSDLYYKKHESDTIESRSGIILRWLQ